jgi:hypothetical protein
LVVSGGIEFFVSSMMVNIFFNVGEGIKCDKEDECDADAEEKEEKDEALFAGLLIKE